MINKITLPADYHIHTVLCKHAEGEVEDYMVFAAGAGIAEMAFSDHAPAPDGYDLANRMEIGLFQEYRSAVSRVRKAARTTVLFGIEADYYEGGADFLKEWLPGQGFDVVLGSIHFIGEWGFDNPLFKDRWDSADVKGVWREYFLLLAKLADTRLFDVVSHLDLPKKFGHRIPDRDMMEIARPALDRVAAAGMAIELNTSGLRRPIQEVYPSPLLLGLAKERNIPICFGSDAHKPNEIGYAFDRAVALARQAGYGECVRFRERRKTQYRLDAP